MKPSRYMCVIFVAVITVSAPAYFAFDSGAFTPVKEPSIVVQTNQHGDPTVVAIAPAISSIKVVSQMQSANGVELTITNTSSQRIVEAHAYLDGLCVGKQFWGIGQNPILPGGNATLQYNYEPTPHTIAIVAVVFEDGTGEGHRDVLAHALTFSNAYRDELRRRLDFLASFVRSGDLYRTNVLQDRLTALLEQINTEPASSGSSKTDPFAAAGRSAAAASIRAPVNKWESLGRKAAVLPYARKNLEDDMTYILDKWLALDRLLVARTSSRSLR